MKTNVLLALDNRRPRQDGTFAVLLRITHHRTSSQITTGIFIPEKDWDSKERKIKSTYRGTESVTRLNNQLQKKKTEAIDAITRLDELGTLDSYSVTQLKSHLERKSDGSSFFQYADTVIEELEKANRIGNARIYRDTMNVLKSFVNKRPIAFRDINHAFLLRFEAEHYSKGNSANGLSVYLRTVRALFNRAIKESIISQELYPFKQYQIPSTKTRKRAISPEAIKLIVGVSLDPDHPLFHTRNYFLLSFYMRGMPFTDLIHLKVSNIIDGRIHYQRQKTDKPYSIKITPQIQELLDIYLVGKKRDDFIFPVIDRTDIEGQYKDVVWARKRYNKKLPKLAELCGIQEHLTSYVSRHSFATIAKNKNVPIAAISEMLGHTDIKTTEIYLASLPSDVLDEYHEKVIK
ncbi:MAG: site-specific integrase [Bacteroidetes bacterium]|nr:site-specific integrase [Bacteroidota bacterium]